MIVKLKEDSTFFKKLEELFETMREMEISFYVMSNRLFVKYKDGPEFQILDVESYYLQSDYSINLPPVFEYKLLREDESSN